MKTEARPVTIKFNGTEYVAETRVQGMILRGFGSTQEEALKQLWRNHASHSPTPASDQLDRLLRYLEEARPADRAQAPGRPGGRSDRIYGGLWRVPGHHRPDPPRGSPETLPGGVRRQVPPPACLALATGAWGVGYLRVVISDISDARRSN